MLRAIFRNSTHVVKQAEPINLQILADVRKTLDLSKPDDVTFWAACLVAFMLMLRKSNYAPVKACEFDQSRQLTRGHIQFVKNKAVWVTIVWTKTLQFRLKQLKFPLLSIPGSELCPVQALQRMVALVPQNSDRPLFCRKNGQAWTYGQFQDKLRSCLKQAGYKARKFSSHSFRRGGCSFCFEAGVPTFLIQTIGDWRSDVYKTYCEISIVTRAKACNAFAKAIKGFNN